MNPHFSLDGNLRSAFCIQENLREGGILTGNVSRLFPVEKRNPPKIHKNLMREKNATIFVHCGKINLPMAQDFLLPKHECELQLHEEGDWRKFPKRPNTAYERCRSCLLFVCSTTDNNSWRHSMLPRSRMLRCSGTCRTVASHVVHTFLQWRHTSFTPKQLRSESVTTRFHTHLEDNFCAPFTAHKNKHMDSCSKRSLARTDSKNSGCGCSNAMKHSSAPRNTIHVAYWPSPGATLPTWTKHTQMATAALSDCLLNFPLLFGSCVDEKEGESSPFLFLEEIADAIDYSWHLRGQWNNPPVFCSNKLWKLSTTAVSVWCIAYCGTQVGIWAH